MRDEAIQTFASFLFERTQNLKIENTFSLFRNIAQGFPQGSL